VFVSATALGVLGPGLPMMERLFALYVLCLLALWLVA
jgi:hypothetical protein